MFQGDALPGDKPEIVNIFKQLLFWAVHLTCILVLWVGVSWVAVAMCFALYVVRMFGITGGFHRYFSHHSYKTSRIFQFLLGFLGTTSAQKGPIWWASHHRHHHRHSDQPEDIHSPVVSSIYYAHVGWVLSSQFIRTRTEVVRDLTKYWELRWLDKLNMIPPVVLAVAVYYFGVFLEFKFPELGTNGFQMLIWGFFISTVLLYHGTFCINSFSHLIGKRRFETNDDSRNNWFLALITLGEGWHNNHHRYPGSERQGFYWWELDITHIILTGLSYLGVVWDLRKPPRRILEAATS
ncbi:MAG: acyl-CoA desaturase [Bdellovibrionales bacterium]|nr:acyl-CoA desaturase [Bdellovibrionales bacterium]